MGSLMFQQKPALQSLSKQYYFIVSSNMTNSRPIAGFLVVLEPATLSSKIPFFLGQNIIGRSESKATVVIKEPSISQKHAKLVATINKTTIIDFNSKNGTKINNEGNYIESDNQVLIDNSMIIYFADAKCRIEMIETKEQSRNFQSVTIRVENKRKQNLGQKQQKIVKEVNVQQKKVQKNEFETILYPSDYDLEEGFQGKEQVQQKQKNNKQQKKKSKKNTKSKPQLNTKMEQNDKPLRNIQQQQKSKKEKNSPAKNKPSQQKQSAVIKKSPKKENKEEKRKSSQAVQKNVRFQQQSKQQKKLKDAENKKAKNEQISKEKLKKMNNQLPKTNKQREDNPVKKKEIKNSKEKRQSKVIQNEQKANNKQIRNKQKNDLNETLVQKQAKKGKHSQQTSFENSGDTTKKKSKMGKKLPSQSLQRELRQSSKRKIVGKRVLFSGFIPKMRRRYFILVEDFNEEFDYLVMKQYTRTFKALLAISKGILIVKYAWIEESQQSLRTLNVNNYLFSKIQPIYQAIERAKSGQKVFQGYQFYLLSEQYHLKISQIQTLIQVVGGQTKTIKGQVKIKDPRKCIAILRNKQQNSFPTQLKNEIGRAKKYGFELIYNIEFLLDGCEKQEINWQNSKL